MRRFVSRVMWIFVVLGAIFLYEGINNTTNSKKTPVDFNTLKESDLKENMIVEGYIDNNYGYFEEEYRTTYGIKTGESIYNYLITIGNNKYMGLKNQTEEQRVALDQQMNDTIDSLNGIGVSPEKFYFKGQIKSMTNQEVGFMKEYLVYMGYTDAEADKLMCKYYVQCVDFEGGMMQIAIGALLLVVGLGGVFLPMIQEWRIEKRKQTMMNSVSSQSSVNSYSNSVYEDPFVADKTDSMSTSPNEDIWNSAPTYSELNDFSNDGNDNSDDGSKTGLRLKL